MLQLLELEQRFHRKIRESIRFWDANEKSM